MLEVEYLEKKIKELKHTISEFEKSGIRCHREYVAHCQRLLKAYRHTLYASYNYISDDGYDELDKYNSWFRPTKRHGEFI